MLCGTSGAVFLEMAVCHDVSNGFVDATAKDSLSKYAQVSTQALLSHSGKTLGHCASDCHNSASLKQP
jgi:hypothetical protein